MALVFLPDTSPSLHITGSHDYVIDCLALGSKLAAHLGGIFANPSVCKVWSTPTPRFLHSEATPLFAVSSSLAWPPHLPVPHPTPKVVHGGENDVMWLQRDFGIYVVNLHDTQKIAAAASYPSLSLAHLLLQLCGVHTNKSFQVPSGNPKAHGQRRALAPTSIIPPFPA